MRPLCSNFQKTSKTPSMQNLQVSLLLKLQYQSKNIHLQNRTILFSLLLKTKKPISNPYPNLRVIPTQTFFIYRSNPFKPSLKIPNPSKTFPFPFRRSLFSIAHPKQQKIRYKIKISNKQNRKNKDL